MKTATKSETKLTGIGGFWREDGKMIKNKKPATILVCNGFCSF